MAKQKLHKRRPRRFRTENNRIPGAEPGFLTFSDEVCPCVTLYSFNATEYKEHQYTSTAELCKFLEANTHLNHWIDTVGYGNKEFFDNLARFFGIHALELEDVVSLHQRPKVEEFENHLFIISRMKYINQQGVFVDEQISLFVFDKVVISFQDYEEDCLGPVRERLKKGNSKIRTENAFFLAYSIQDAIIDNYFPVIDELSNKLERLEEEVLINPRRMVLGEMQEIKRTLIDLRKSIWPEKDKMMEILRSNYKLVIKEHEIYLRDTYDHAVQIMDLIETNKEIAHSIMDIYLSSVNNKLSEVMKVLTVVSSVFIPLTFIVGIYGMNFSAEDKAGNPLPLNMPELYHPYGYAGVMLFMFTVAVAQIIYFKRKKWL